MTVKTQLIDDENGNHVMAVLPINNDYLELTEDLEDLAAIAERKDEPSIPFEQALDNIGYGKLHDTN